MTRRAPSGRPLLAALALLLFLAPGARAQATVEGWFHVLWGDPQTGEAVVEYRLSTLDGRFLRLELDGAVPGAPGGPLTLNRQRVAVQGRFAAPLASGPGIVAEPTLVVTAIQPREPGARFNVAPAAAPPQAGGKPYVTILCRWADSTAVTPKPRDYYQELLTGSSRPGLDHYWRELSEDRVSLAGSTVYGWYDLPDTLGAYFTARKADGTVDLEKLNFTKLTADCAGRADAEVDFRQYSGVNLQINTRMPYSWGGSRYLSLDGVNRVMPMTWMANWAGQSTYAHEIGHSFGLPHSSGTYGKVYDSRWDVMSGGGRWETIGTQREHVASHTIAWHKELLAWLPAARKLTVTPQTDATVQLLRGAVPAAAGDYLMAQVPLPDGSFYTVEARHQNGYDTALTGEGLVIHLVRTTDKEPAKVVDPDGNGNPNDAGATWTPGESFTDPAHDLAVTVLARTPAGFQVRIVRGSAPVVMALDGALRGAAVGVPFQEQLRATGGLGTFTWSVADGALPPGLTLEAETGMVRGTPTTRGAFAATLRATSGTRSSTAGYQVQVFDPVVISSDTLRAFATVGTEYADSLAASGGDGPVSWFVTGGRLPAGLTLAPATGRIFGTATEAGVFRFTVTAETRYLRTSRAFTLLASEPLQPSAILDQLLGSGTLTPPQQQVLDAVGNGNGRVDVGDVRAWLGRNGQLDPRATEELRRVVEAMQPAPRP